jgi:hypothetical protein
MQVTKDMILNAQFIELRAIMAELKQNPEENLDSVMKRRPPWIGWIDENGNVRESPRGRRL